MAFQKGQSGNPSGRPKKSPDDKSIQSLARDHTHDAIRTLAAIMQDGDAPPSARVSAANTLLDRGYGKPPQFVTGDPNAYRKASDLTDDELANIASGSGDGASEAPEHQAFTH